MGRVGLSAAHAGMQARAIAVAKADRNILHPNAQMPFELTATPTRSVSEESVLTGELASLTLWVSGLALIYIGVVSAKTVDLKQSLPSHFSQSATKAAFSKRYEQFLKLAYLRSRW
jgi:hypothetical protein